MTKREKILYPLTLLFFITFYLPSQTQTANGILIFTMAFYSFFFYSWKDKWELLKERKHVIGMVVFFAMVVVSLFLSENQNRGWSFLDKRLSLLYLPISVGLIQTRKEFRDKVLLTFSVVTTVACLILLSYGIYNSGFLSNPALLYNDSLTEIIERQSIYIALLVTIAIFIYAYHLLYTPLSKGTRIAIIASIVFLYIFSYLLASRNMMIILYLVTLGFAFYYILSQKKYLQGSALLVALLIGIFTVFKLFPHTLNRFKELTYTKFEYQNKGMESHYNMEVKEDQWNGANFRLAAWSCGWELFKRNPLLGVDLGDKREELFKMYEEKSFHFALEHQKSVHSNYLDILYSMGILGFLPFLLGWVLLPLRYAWKYKDGLAMLIIATFAIAMVTEIYFDRTVGGMAIGFFIPFVLSDKKKRQP